MSAKIKAVAPVLTLPSTNIYLNRELSQLAFNRRVLAQAEDATLPLLERLRYLCIVSSNLDEFFEVRIASLLAHDRMEGRKSEPPALTAALERTSIECHQLVERQYELLNRDILPQLSEKGVHLLRHHERNDAQRAWVKEYFDREVRPLLTPIALDPAHPFPQVVNKSLNFIVELSGKDAFGRGTGIAILKAPRVLPRVIRLPDHLSTNGVVFCLLSSVIHAHIADLFTGREVVAYSQFRVTRNSDLWVDEEEVKNLRQALQSELQSRQFGFAVRLEVARNCPPHLASFLLEQFSIDKSRLYAVDGPVNMVRLLELINSVQQPILHFPAFQPGLPQTLVDGDMFALLRKRDVLLHHPFQSFQPIVEFIRCAALDPNVVAIKQTIYRTGMNSSLMESLIIAAQRGKEVTVIVELMARFDEEANINWAERLERVGAQVVYGVVGLKTHAKLALVLRREASELRHYAHLGTGNYHPTTTKFYTDFGLLTAHPALTAEVNEVFIHLTSLTKPKKLNYLWLAPFDLQKEIIRAIRNEAAIAREGRPARIIAKMNALLDESVIRALYAASADGVKIDLIVRGACALRPGVPHLSENIRVRSIVGRFLEHSRIYFFRNDRKNDVYLASADWMNRNLFRRVEVAFPVLDPKLKRQVIAQGLNPYLKDNTNSWELVSDGSYRKRKPIGKQRAFCAQQYLAQTLGA
ncbi:polyphosphate kinase 1 [Noviherbaspirillum autotrophicum]|uniref:Polyphosphate kinase n=1 Tax=Noviherbaspirillum autotrophicum TaxID=709839 RepID=A0A0C1YAQ0_9BURK|nr:polyphosphate kinase 1 [Noviherbaspirillum autotrophicum]KIF81670.1 polyphosphate kinase [Noviherbaspirillum autotrophicum]KIF82031.1 polyphosphate kinase [Noviherbaspirillum autotrophicum]KIF84083.1 polyphosphate kinase [Noviherbaspirillum autotrophicum]